jgi:stage II sporulation protein D
MKSALLKVSYAMAVISLYTYTFGVMDTVGVQNELLNRNPVVHVRTVSGDYDSDVTSEPPSLAIGESRTTRTTDKVPDKKMPGLANYDAPVISVTHAPHGADIEDIENAPADSNSGTSVTTTAPRTTTPEYASVRTTTPPSTDVTVRASSATAGNSSNPPAETLRVRSSGQVVTGDAFDIITRIVQNEIGGTFHAQAIKAQAIAAYTFVKKENLAGGTPTVLLAATASDRVKELVREIWGQAVYHNGELITAVYGASSAGWTSSSRNVWGGDLPYLRSVRCAFDELHDPNMGRPATFSSDEIRANVLRTTGIELSGNPDTWLRIIDRVDTVYVGLMSIGGHTSFTHGGATRNITGRVFRETVMGFSLRSASFTFTYDSGSDTFTFVTNGYGHGAGMSQWGAQILATHHGFSYVDILQHYYSGVEVR